MRKGMIFALDAAIAATILVIVVINSFYYFSTSSKESFSQAQMVRLSSDIISAFDREGYIDQIVINDALEPPSEQKEITPEELPLSTILPPNYKMLVTISDLKESPIPDEQSNLAVGSDLEWQTLYLSAATRHYLQTKIDFDTGGADVFAQVFTESGCENGETGPEQRIRNPVKDGVYIFPEPFTFIAGINYVCFHKGFGGAVKLQWFRILGAEAYAANSSGLLIVPDDRFVATGEHYTAVYESAISWWGPHWIRFTTWLGT